MATVNELQERVEQVAGENDIEINDTEEITERMIGIGTQMGYDRDVVIDQHYEECEPFFILAARIQTK